MIHRSYLGWVRDLASEARPDAAWPSIEIDAALLRDYDQTFAFMQRIGLNEIVLWGLFTERSWSPDVENTIDAARAAQVRDLIQRAHEHDLKVLAGVGLYSWGFGAASSARCKMSPLCARRNCELRTGETCRQNLQAKPASKTCMGRKTFRSKTSF